jgi:hypothetical protein
METRVLSNEFVMNATFTPNDAFVSIGYGIEVMLPKDAKSGDSWVLHIEPYKTPKHLASTVQGKDLFITSEQQILSQIQGNLVLSPNDTKQVVNLPNRAPQAQLNHRSSSLVSFFNHLFLTKGRTLWWTDLDNVWEWLPHPHSEADFRTIEWETENITGLVRSEDKLFVHFPTAIYHVAYVGKPTIINIQGRVHGVGCVTPRALVVHNSIQFFLGSDNFYLWSIDTGLNVIGQDVWKRFVRSRGPLEETWAYIDLRNNEICWVSGDYIWAFNFIEKHWQKYSTDGIVDHASAPWSLPYPALDETLSTIDQDQIDGLENLFVTEQAVCREARANDPLVKCLEFSQPYLESDDITYGDLHLVKRCDLVMLDMRTNFPWAGVRVRLSGRDFVSHPSRWVDCGLWTQNHFGKQIDFRAVAGKVLKFRFELEDGLQWNLLLPNGGLSLNGKRLDIANGEIIMNGSRCDFLGRQFQVLNGTQSLGELSSQTIGNPELLNHLGFAELNAWGERVDLPQSLVGPDK